MSQLFDQMLKIANDERIKRGEPIFPCYKDLAEFMEIEKRQIVLREILRSMTPGFSQMSQDEAFSIKCHKDFNNPREE